MANMLTRHAHFQAAIGQRTEISMGGEELDGAEKVVELMDG